MMEMKNIRLLISNYGKMNTPLFLKSTILLLFLFLCSCASNKIDQSSNEIMIYLVRHAEKADDGTKDPPLTSDGQKRAVFLSTYLKVEIKKVQVNGEILR